MNTQQFGLGLRTAHYADFLREHQAVDWLEIITDNYLVEGGKPLVMLDKIRRDYPMAMHGVAMSLGAAEPVDLAYLARVKKLADRIEPLWVSDHLCWIGAGKDQLHDLYPLPYTDEAAQHVIKQIRRVQDFLQRRLVVENVSSYIEYKDSAVSEWQFLSYVAQEADCDLLVDVNNIYVSSVNHRFNPLDYLKALPASRVRQIHLAGHSTQGEHIIDTHDHPVCKEVWDLYAQACRLWGRVHSMIERDDHIPPLQELLGELATARTIARESCQILSEPPRLKGTRPKLAPTTKLKELQLRMKSYVLDQASEPMHASVATPAGVDSKERLNIYHNAYRARLSEILADTFAKTYLYLGSDLFDQHAAQFAVRHPPQERSLNRYGAAFANYLRNIYPNNPELFELASLEFALRICFDGADAPPLTRELAQQDSAQSWLQQSGVLNPSVQRLVVTTNVVAIWHAINNAADVPPVEHLHSAATLLVWRKDLQPHFRTLTVGESTMIAALSQGQAISQATENLADTEHLPEPALLGQWMSTWLDDEILTTN